MKIVILAAGKGSRLGEKNVPKPLTQLSNGMSILQYQIDQLTHHFSFEDIFIVVGHRKELIMEAFPAAGFIYSPHYAQENTSKSLLRALNKFNEDVLWLNGDVVFHPTVLQKMSATKRNAMLVNEGPVGEEEVKYQCDAEGKITTVSKTVNASAGEALGINFFTGDSLNVLRKHLNLCAPNDYFEKAIEMSIKEGLAVWSLPVERDACTEIDFPEDLERANQLLKQWQL